MKRIRPHTRLLHAWRAWLVLLSIPATFAVSLLMQIGSVIWLISVGAWGFAFLYLYLFYLPARWRGLSFSLDTHAISRRSGVFFLKTEALPTQAVRFTSIVRDPVLRVFGLCTLRVAAPGAGLSIHGLTQAEARELSMILSLTLRGGEEPTQ